MGSKGSDSFEVTGTFSSFTVVDENGDDVSEYRFDTRVDGEPAPVYGGGDGYQDTVTGADGDYVVEGLDELHEALRTASRGDIVFVPSGVECYCPSKNRRIHVPAGVTLASDRGVDGHDGALIHTDATYSYGADGLLVAGDDARITGLRIRGPHPDPDGGWREHSYDYEMSGIECAGANVEVDNCEVWGWAHNIRCGANTHAHHNYSHHANMKGLGYCFSTGAHEGAIIEYNYCEHWRHVVAADGTGGFEARFNVIDGPAMAHAMDQHSPGGTYTSIHHNTYRVHDDVASGDPRAPFATFRGEDVTNAEVYKNWSYNELEPREEPSESFTDEFITKPKNGGTGWDGIEWWDNHLGMDAPDDPDVGAPRPYNV